MDKGIIVHSAIMKEGRLLLLKRVPETYQGNLWDLPGGTLEDGEDPATGAAREAREETGAEIKDLDLFFQAANVDERKNKQFITLIFTAEAEGDLAEVKLSPDEHSEYAWVPLDEVAGYETVPYMDDCVRALRKRLG